MAVGTDAHRCLVLSILIIHQIFGIGTSEFHWEEFFARKREEKRIGKKGKKLRKWSTFTHFNGIYQSIDCVKEMEKKRTENGESRFWICSKNILFISFEPGFERWHWFRWRLSLLWTFSVINTAEYDWRLCIQWELHGIYVPQRNLSSKSMPFQSIFEDMQWNLLKQTSLNDILTQIRTKDESFYSKKWVEERCFGRFCVWCDFWCEYFASNHSTNITHQQFPWSYFLCS